MGSEAPLGAPHLGGSVPPGVALDIYDPLLGFGMGACPLRDGAGGALGGVMDFAEKGVEMRIFGLKNCDTCRKAVKLLDGYRFFDVRVDLIPDEILDAALQGFGDDLVNKKSTTWRS